MSANNGSKNHCHKPSTLKQRQGREQVLQTLCQRDHLGSVTGSVTFLNSLGIFSAQ